jgi:hypothetical protein
VLSKDSLFSILRIFRISSITYSLPLTILLYYYIKRTFNSVEVVSSPQKAVQSFAINPAEIISLPRLTVPAARGTFTIIILCEHENMIEDSNLQKRRKLVKFL